MKVDQSLFEAVTPLKLEQEIERINPIVDSGVWKAIIDIGKQTSDRGFKPVQDDALSAIRELLIDSDHVHTRMQIISILKIGLFAGSLSPEAAKLALRTHTENATKRAKKAANALHDKPGGSRDKAKAIQGIWATGKYSSKDICAEQECAALEMSFKAARNALTNQPKK